MLLSGLKQLKMMKFNNRENKCLKTTDGGHIWNSRSLAVVGMVLMRHLGEIYVLMGKRGPGLPNEVGKYCMPCGYLDWDETCEEAVVREIYEESGLNIYKILETYNILYDHMHFPWRIHSIPDNNVQNVSMHYAIFVDTSVNAFRDYASLPDLTIENNVDKDEVEESKWININDLYKYDCAFGHDSVIRVFINSLPNIDDLNI
jgi:ADP-ribose pyrophosphatase YjhB (NUDIX family)